MSPESATGVSISLPEAKKSLRLGKEVVLSGSQITPPTLIGVAWALKLKFAARMAANKKLLLLYLPWLCLHLRPSLHLH